jgi:tetratricopeptide (TPR) repeat protein
MILEISRMRDSLVPFDLEWKLPAGEVYEGQSVAAILEMRGIVEIRVPESVSVPKPAGALFEEVGGLGGISSVTAGERELYSVPVSSWMLTPSSAGLVSLPAARVKAFDLIIDSAPRSIKVRSLPPGIKDSGAIGRFTVDCRTDSTEILSGENINLFFRVTGEGNLNYLQAPPVQFDDVLVTGQETASELEAFDFGYRGWIEWSFRLSPRKTGNISLKIPAFFCLDPESGVIRTFAEKSLRINIRERKTEEPLPAAEKREILRSWDVEDCEPWNLYKKPYSYAFILLPCGFFFVRGILKARKKSAAGILGVLLVSFGFLGAAGVSSRQEGLNLVDRGAAAYDRENYEEAESLFRKALESLAGSPGLYFNLGLVRGAMDDTAESLFWLRMAAFRNPAKTFIRERLEETEKNSGITHAASVPAIHPDVFFVFFSLSLCAACLLPWLVKKRTILFVCLVILLLAAGFSAGGIAWQASSLSREWGIVAESGVSLRKIPLPESSDWIKLAEGTALDVESHSGTFVLVSTGSGIRGWVEEKALRFNNGLDNGLVR